MTGLDMPRAVDSVKPYPSPKKNPISFTFAMSSPAMGALPELKYRIRSLSFISCTLGWLTIAVIMVGTTGKKLIWSNFAMVLNTSSKSKRCKRIWVAQLNKAQFMATILP